MLTPRGESPRTRLNRTSRLVQSSRLPSRISKLIRPLIFSLLVLTGCENSASQSVALNQPIEHPPTPEKKALSDDPELNKQLQKIFEGFKVLQTTVLENINLVKDPDVGDRIVSLFELFEKKLNGELGEEDFEITIQTLPAGTAASYTPSTRTLTLDSDFSADDLSDLSVLAHELAHVDSNNKRRKEWGEESYNQWLETSDHYGVDIHEEALAYSLHIEILNILTDNMMREFQEGVKAAYDEMGNTAAYHEQTAIWAEQTIQSMMEKLNADQDAYDFLRMMLRGADLYYLYHSAETPLPRRFVNFFVGYMNMGGKPVIEYLEDGQDWVGETAQPYSGQPQSFLQFGPAGVVMIKK